MFLFLKPPSPYVHLATVGYGDQVPQTRASRLFTCCYAFLGVGILGIALGILGSNLIDAQDKAIAKAQQASKNEMLKVFGINTSPKKSNKDNDDMMDSVGDDTGDDADLVNVVEYGYDDHGRLQGYQAKKQQQPKRSSTNSKNLTNSGRQDDDDEMGCVRTIVLQSAPLLVILLLLAFWIGDDSGWDWSETIYYFVITGT